MNNHKIQIVLGSVCVMAGVTIVGPAATYGQSASGSASNSGLEEVVVTAQRRDEKMVDVPISITALDAEAMTTANVQSLGDISKLTPSLRFDNQAGFF
jgi:iron complex outermembrane receptor protein